MPRKPRGPAKPSGLADLVAKHGASGYDGYHAGFNRAYGGEPPYGSEPGTSQSPGANNDVPSGGESADVFERTRLNDGAA
jgi:hypothetical protein